MTVGKRQIVERSPKKAEGMAMVIERLMSPLPGQKCRRETQLK